MADRRPDQGIFEDVSRGLGCEDLCQRRLGQDSGGRDRAIPHSPGQSPSIEVGNEIAILTRFRSAMTGLERQTLR